MTHIIAQMNLKGGVSKTSSSINLACIMASKGYKTLIIDLDLLQGDLADSLGLALDENKDVMYGLMNPEQFKDCIFTLEFGDTTIDVCPANDHLYNEIDELRNHIKDDYSILKRCIDNVPNKYDFVFLDLPAYFDISTKLGLAAADCYNLIVDCERLSYKNIVKNYNNIQFFKHQNDIGVYCLSLLLTRCENVNLHKQTVNQVFADFGDDVYKEVIPKNIDVGESINARKPLIVYAPTSKAYLAYVEVADEMLVKLGINERMTA